ncbi:MAG: hypothetical protein K2J76_08705, partial [Oscillospiraceae bacterium]|nr:hypothetical protein [Oscillospiraceae bacterium]
KPSEELVNSVLDIPNVSAVPKKTRRRSFFGKYSRAVVIAFCGLMVCGCTAAATNVIKFGELFGGIFFADNDEFADSLVGTVKDFSYKVSDEDYKISVKGITGNDSGYFAVAEISRADGEPVADHFVNPMEIFPENKDFPDNKNYITPSWIERGSDDFYVPASYDSYVNSAKNIEIYVSLEPLSFQSSDCITIRGEDFFPSYKYWDFMKENNVFYVRYQEPEFSGYIYHEWGEDDGTSNADFVPVDFDDSSIIALDLEWEFTFTPVPSKQAKKAKTAKKFDEDFVYILNVYERGDFENVVAEYERIITPVSINVTPLGTDIEYTYPMPESEYENPDKYSIWETNINNEIFLILKDGSTVKSWVGRDGCSINADGTGYNGTMHIVYRDFTVENSKEAVVNVKDVKAISINGTVYNLK